MDKKTTVEPHEFLSQINLSLCRGLPKNFLRQHRGYIEGPIAKEYFEPNRTSSMELILRKKLTAFSRRCTKGRIDYSSCYFQQIKLEN